MWLYRSRRFLFYTRLLRKKNFLPALQNSKTKTKVSRYVISKLLRKRINISLTLPPPHVHYSVVMVLGNRIWYMANALGMFDCAIPSSGFLWEEKRSIHLSRLICGWINRYVQEAHWNATERGRECIFFPSSTRQIWSTFLQEIYQSWFRLLLCLF